MSLDLLAGLISESRPGRCLMCDERIPAQRTGGKRVLCGSADCRRVYLRLYATAWKKQARAKARRQ